MKAAAPSRALSVRGLGVWYGSAHAVFGLDIDVEQGETVGLLGRNGAGKTSTMLGILGQGCRRRGKIFLDGADITSLPVHKAARQGLAWVPDNRRIFPTLTVRDNFAVARMGRRSGLDDSEAIDIFPPLSRLMNRLGGLLSGGEQQMVAIARALIQRPRVLLIDEPTEGLAPVMVEQVIAALTRMRTELGQAVLLAEADLSVVREVASRVTVLSVGHPVFTGTITDLDSSDELQRRYLSLGIEQT